MPGSVEIRDRTRPFYDIEPKLHPRRSFIYIAVELIATVAVWYNYPALVDVYRQLGPACLGSATAALAQSLNQMSKHKHLESRLAKFVVWGAINGFFTSLWLDMLMVQLENPLVRMLVDQSIGAPLFQLTFTALSNLWDGDNVLVSAIQATYLRSLRYSYCFWPLVSAAMFTVIPPDKMLPCNFAANFIWNVILSRLS